MSKALIGTVCSVAQPKTIVVRVDSRKEHPLYRKQYSVSKKFMVHDPDGKAKLGDRVAIIPTRPLSARKRYALERVIEKAAIVHTEAEPEVLAQAKKAPNPVAAKPSEKEEKA